MISETLEVMRLVKVLAPARVCVPVVTTPELTAEALLMPISPAADKVTGAVADTAKVPLALGTVRVLVVPVVMPESCIFMALVESPSSVKETVASSSFLLVKVWVSVVPTTGPEGAVLVALLSRSGS